MYVQEECIDSLVRKAGYSGRIDARLRQRIRLTRYQVPHARARGQVVASGRHARAKSRSKGR